MDKKRWNWFQGKTADKEKYKQEMHDNYEKDLLSYTNIWAAKTKMFEFNSLAWNLSVSIRPEIYLHFSEYVTIVAKCKGNSNLVGWLDPLPLSFDEGNAPNEKIIFDELL